jgi:hypothetical protein
MLPVMQYHTVNNYVRETRKLFEEHAVSKILREFSKHFPKKSGSVSWFFRNVREPVHYGISQKKIQM